jgi:hypothetical protein
VFLDVGLQCLFRMAASVNGVTGRGVGMVSGGFMLPGLVMLGSFDVVAGGMGKVLRGLLVVFCGFLRHEFSPRLTGCDNTTQEIVAAFLPEMGTAGIGPGGAGHVTPK